MERGKPTDLLGAVKATGAFGGLRYGVLGAFEDDVELPGRLTASGDRVKVRQDGRNFGVVRALYESSGKTRRSFGYLGTLVTLPDDDATAHAIDAHYLSGQGRIKLDAQVMASDGNGEKGYGTLIDLVYAQSNTDGFLNRMGIFTNHTFFLKSNQRLRFEADYYPHRWDDRNSRGNGMFKTDGRWFTQFAYGSDSSKRFSWSGTVGAEQEELNGSWSYSTDLEFTFNPTDNITFDLDLRYRKRDGWLLYRNGRNLTTYKAEDIQPRLSMDYFISARQQLRFTMQWAGIRATAQDYWQIPISEGELVNSNLDDGFGNLLTDAIDNPVLDFLVLKLRYRFGS